MSSQRPKRACRDLCCLRPKAVKGEPEPVGNYVAQSLGPSKASRQRHKGDDRDLCCLRPKATEGELPKA